MKIQTTRAFSLKVQQINDPSFFQKFRELIAFISSPLGCQKFKKDSIVEDGVYTYRIGDYRLFYTSVSNDIIFVDVAEVDINKLKVRTFPKDPLRNHTLHPTYNHTINPVYNHTINPVYNHTLHPSYNHTINPAYNRLINPAFNHTINPNYNHSIHPAFNHSINPIYNHSINPLYNTSFPGIRVYEVSTCNCIYYVLDAKEDGSVKIVYDKNNRPLQFLVKNDKGYCAFDFNSKKVVAYWYPDNVNGFVIFDVNMAWKWFAC